MPQTWAATAVLAASTTVEQPSTPVASQGKATATPSSPAKNPPVNIDMSQLNALWQIAEMLAGVIWSSKLDTLTKQTVVKVIKITREAELKELDRELSNGEKVKVSAIHMAVRGNLVSMYNDLMIIYNSLNKKIQGVQVNCKTISDNTSKVLSGIEEAKTDTKDLASKVNKVTSTTDKIASDANTYWKALLSKPAAASKTAANPRVLSNMEQKAKQILVDIFDKDDNNILSKSLMSIVEKANKTIAGLKCASKPKDIKVVAAVKMHGKAVLLTLNNKEAVNWIREPLNETEFSTGFSTKSFFFFLYSCL